MNRAAAGKHATGTTTFSERHHIARHLAHRWFAYLEAPGGDLDAHLAMFHPKVRLSGRRGEHVFAHDHKSLVAWFGAVPDAVSSHHIVHATYAETEEGDGLMNMVVAYQAASPHGVRGSIISYETRVEFAEVGARFVALDKTPILANTKARYETSWSANRVLGVVHADLGGIGAADGRLRAALGNDVWQLHAQVRAPEGCGVYEALITAVSDTSPNVRALRIEIVDDGRAPLAAVRQIEVLDAAVLND